ncbi:PAS domain S-box protein [Seonamhaeicola sp.]|uniref:PAS domain-containing sensor histidine kinase n=1 Tax=Seonamhaeicola sp. TaxID=1912245 RepID=UPI0026030AE7|nr:PAS domain S-box protein [Seonamhaeicola sp.]
MSQDKIDMLQRALAREKAARKQAEKILENKSAELYDAKQKLEKSYFELESLLNRKDSELQGVFENIVDAYVIIDLWGNILKMNDAAVNLLGFDNPKEDYNLMDMARPNDIELVTESFKTLLKEGSITDFYINIITKKKEEKLVHINASIIYDKGAPVAAQGIVRDVTEAKRNAELIEEQKKELDVIVQNSSLGIVLTESGNIVRTNEAFQKLLGYSESELSKLTIKDISLKEDFPLSRDFLMKMDSGKIDNFVVQKRYKKKDGSVVWAKTNVNAVRSSTGDIKYQVALVEDITSDRERSLIIDMINDLAKAILGKMDIYEIAWEITHNIAEYLNTDDCVIYLVDQDQGTLEQIAAYGEKVTANHQIINKIKLPIGKGIVGTVAKTGKAELIKNTEEDKRYIVDEKRRFSEITVPIISDGQVIGIIDSEHIDKNYYTLKQLHTLENIANLVAMQLKSAINLRERQKVESKNKDLLNELAKSNDELQEYAHMVSHDLKSPLRSIDALVNWIKEDNEDKLDAVSLKNFELIETTLEKMEQLIADVLMYSSVGAQALEEELVDLNDIVKELEKILFIPKHISIKVLNPLPKVNGDITKLKQLFQNLISNAIKFNDKPKGLVEIDFQEQKTHYQFSVKDNGMGIEEEYHSKIFEIFHVLNKREDSTGIGLSIVKKIVKLHMGDIWIDSELGKGTTFYFTLKK